MEKSVLVMAIAFILFTNYTCRITIHSISELLELAQPKNLGLT